MAPTCVVIDDSRAMLLMLASVLHSEGWAPACFQGTEAALREAVARRLAGKPFDVAIVDLSEASADVVNRLRECGCIVALCSGRSAEELESAAREWDVEMFSRKTPRGFDALVKRVVAALDR